MQSIPADLEDQAGSSHASSAASSTAGGLITERRMVLYTGPRFEKRRKKIIVCCDGTWNSEHFKQPQTNVSRVARAIKPYDEDVDRHYKKDSRKSPQVVLYLNGIGTGTSAWANIGDAIWGRGIKQNICEAYQFICHNYSTNEDDQIYLFGFSRGAFTAQCVAQLISNIGLLSKAGLPYLSWIYEAWEEAMKLNSMGAAEQYLEAQEYPTSPPWWGLWKKPESELDPLTLQDMRRKNLLHPHTKTRALAVWDNVKSLGYPRLPSRRLANLLDWRGRFRLVNSTLPSQLQQAIHALALHEHRASFSPIVWNSLEEQKGSLEALHQCWFLGCHGDVGGGSAGTVVFAHISLLWVLSKLIGELTFDLSELQSTFGIAESAPPNLRFESNRRQVRKDASVRMSDSMKGYYRAGGSRWRYPRAFFWDVHGEQKAEINENDDMALHYNQDIHWTVRLLQKHPAVLPLAWLNQCKITEGPRPNWWIVPKSAKLPAYKIREHRATGTEVTLMRKWAPRAVEVLLNYNEDVPKYGSGNIAICLLYLLGNYSKNNPSLKEHIPKELGRYNLDPGLVGRVQYIDGLPYFVAEPV